MPPSASGLARPREDELHLEVGGDLLQMLRGEVLPVIGVESARDATDVPAWITLAPDRQNIEDNACDKECNRKMNNDRVLGVPGQKGSL